ncbi:type 1 glutamine amidotransferase [Roseomonas sp. KE2513]|uniref:type 1 glutamine amidotransferase domain-containing protein n=1 Tax=Roseomonas sp. KE2513 TaxID=2479202 RepID=UPI0018DF5643|nr:type 1 glutamine amidotransferase domain-containing protein [Roseomonas sp. KE2513]MBI0536137.1 type 1 glutamine amidotransferase [Roseomonas sp. KE2513]
MADATHRRVAILATDGVERVELTEPLKALKAAGMDAAVVSLKLGEIQSMDGDVNPAEKIAVDVELADAHADAFDALVLPGGTTNPDKLRMNEAAVAFVRAFAEAGKPIAAICHGPWSLIEAGAVKGRRMTSYPSLKTDLRNAGATWVDETCVVEGNFVTSRNPKDLPAFCEKMVEAVSRTAPRAAAA